jgi:hypothetical protein
MTPGPPVWPKWVACPICATPAGRHRGQRAGVRSYACGNCLHTWSESPLAFHAVDAAGEEIVIPADQIDALSQSGTPAQPSA